LRDFRERPAAEMRARAADFLAEMARRRSVRAFERRPLPDGVLEDCLRAAGTAPSGANLQPWRFVVVRDPEVKRRIRLAAEEEERAFYAKRAPPEWLEVLAPLGTDANKPFLEDAPSLIAVFGERYGLDAAGRKQKRYYVDESVGLACGLLIAALHRAGLATLTHTPSPMGFLRDVLGRPENERPFLLVVVGYPAADATVPRITRKSLDEIAVFV
jgi:nitroreductase